MRPYTTAGDGRFRDRVRSWAAGQKLSFDDEHHDDATAVQLVRELGRATQVPTSATCNREGRFRKMDAFLAVESSTLLSALRSEDK